MAGTISINKSYSEGKREDFELIVKKDNELFYEYTQNNDMLAKAAEIFDNYYNLLPESDYHITIIGERGTIDKFTYTILHGSLAGYSDDDDLTENYEIAQEL